MEIRFRSNEELEKKIEKLKDSMGFSEKRDLVVFLINREYDSIIKAEMLKSNIK